MTKVYVVTKHDDMNRVSVDSVYSTEEAALKDVQEYNSSGWAWTWKDYKEMTLDEPSDLWCLCYNTLTKEADHVQIHSQSRSSSQI